LAFGGSLEKLFLELLGSIDGIANGMGGSASIHSKEQGIFGHDGLMGSQAPIAVGYAFASEKLTICYAGDASAEEDYYLAALGWASTKKLPILFIVEDNNLSIMTKVSVRRSWKISDVGEAFGMKVFDIDDDPKKILASLDSIKNFPALLNIKTNRLYWHAGAGVDDPNIFDRHKNVCDDFDQSFIQEVQEHAIDEINTVWKKCKNH
jgi:pyruvate dehydrogenase E1 component alpha subunit